MILRGACSFIAILLFQINLWANLHSFDDFHSNLGQILEIDAATTLDPLAVNTANKDQVESFALKAEFSDEDLEDLLFGDLFAKDDLGFDVPLELEPMWIDSWEIESMAGYADNPLYGNHNPQGSPYGGLGLETFFLTQGNPRHELLLYLFAEGKKFTDLGKEDVSGLILGQINYSFTPEASLLGYGMRIQHTFYDQGMDFSEIGLPYRMKVSSNRSAIYPRLEWRLLQKVEGELEIGVEREAYRQIEDQSEVAQISISFAGPATDKLKWTTKLEGKKTRYEHRTPKTGDGSNLDGRLDSHAVKSAIGLEYSHEEEWFDHTGLKISHKRTIDHTGNYYDYNQWKLNLSQGFSWNPWALELSGGYANTGYTERETENGEMLDRRNWNLDFDVSRSLGRNWKGFLRWNHEQENSNDPDYRYGSNFWTLGMSWQK